jgi:hypothetical protein
MACGTSVGISFKGGICVKTQTNYKYPQDVPSPNVVAIFASIYR